MYNKNMTGLQRLNHYEIAEVLEDYKHGDSAHYRNVRLALPIIQSIKDHYKLELESLWGKHDLKHRKICVSARDNEIDHFVPTWDTLYDAHYFKDAKFSFIHS